MNLTADDLVESQTGAAAANGATPAQGKSVQRSRLQDAVAIIILLGTLAACFSRTLFGGQSMSRIALTAEWDSLFHAFATGHSSLYDPSLVQLFAPEYFLVGKIFQQGFLPLWNPYNGFGCPLVGDIQASIFSPLRLFFNMNPSIESWNFMLLGELALCGVSTFVLARYLKLGRIPALFAAIAYTLCPFNVWYLELNLGTASCIFPLAFYLFARAARLRTPISAMLAGVGSAFLILSGHPESAFFGITFGSFFMMCLMLLDPTLTTGQISRLLSFRRAVTVAGITTVALTAPVLFPFIEYLCNSETYKYASVCSAHVPWPGVLQHLLNPASGGASPFTGIVTAICLPAVFLAFRKGSPYRSEAVSVLITAVIAFLIVSQIGQLEPIFSQPPLTVIITRYCLPVLLLTCPLLAAFGISELFRFDTENNKTAATPANKTANSDSQIEADDSLNFAPPDQTSSATADVKSTDNQKAGLLNRIPKGIQVLICATIFALALPWLLKDNSDWLKLCSFDLMLPTPAFNSIAWKRDFICALAVIALAVAAVLIRKQLPVRILAALVLIPAFISVGAAAKTSLPLQPKFNYPVVEPLPDMQSSNWRSLSTGEHLFRPSTNAVYGVQDVRVHNPLFPPRYLSFMKECGAHIDMFNQNFDSTLNPLLGIASTRYFLSQLPVSFTDAQPKNEKQLISQTPLSFNADVSLNAMTLWSAGSAAGGTMQWQLSPAAKANYTFAPVLFDAKGNVLWFGDHSPLQSSTATASAIIAKTYLLPVPAELATGKEQLSLGVQLFDRKNNKFIVPGTDGLSRDSTAIISPFTPQPANSADDSKQPRLLKECAGHIRLYENPRAMPRAYVVHAAIVMPDKKQALAYMASTKFSAQKQVVLEADSLPKQQDQEVAPASMPATFTTAALEQRGPNELVTKFFAPAPGYLVLTDTFYPGWKAYLDGKETAVLRGNYLFRAVQVPAGQHSVVYRYEPISFALGLACFLLFIAGLAMAAIRPLVSAKRS